MVVDEKDKLKLETTEEIETELEQMEMQDLENIKECSIKKIDKKSKYEHLKQISKNRYGLNNKKLEFYISKSIKVKGKIINSEFENLQQISLIKEVLIRGVDENINKLIFFDEQVDKRNLIRVEDSFDVEFRIYKLKTKDREYFLLAQENEKLDLEEYIIEGTLIHLKDYADLGKYSKLNLKIPLILLHTAKKRVIEFKDIDECLKKVEVLKLNDENKLKSSIFNKGGIYYQNKPIYEDLILSQLLSSKKKGYPLHLVIVGNVGSGKSTMVEAIHEKSGEINEPFEGTTSTFKELIPSFKGTSPKVGYIIESNRLCFTDEFLRVLMRVEREERSSYLTFLNTLLEHKKRRMGSGNGGFTGQMNSKLIAVTNPVYGTHKMKNLVNKFEESITFLSRVLIYYQDEEHNKFVNEKKNDERLLIKADEMSKNNFLSIYDFMNSVEVNYNHDKIKEIFEKLKNYLNEYDKEDKLIKDMFVARYYHHLECLLDGIVKLRCIIELDNDLTAKEEDYSKLEIMMKDVFRGWGIVVVDNETI